jgi:hypothetical protein
MLRSGDVQFALAVCCAFRLQSTVPGTCLVGTEAAVREPCKSLGAPGSPPVATVEAVGRPTCYPDAQLLLLPVFCASTVAPRLPCSPVSAYTLVIWLHKATFPISPLRNPQPGPELQRCVWTSR